MRHAQRAWTVVALAAFAVPARAEEEKLVADIVASGTRTVAANEVLSGIRTKKGYRYDAATVESDVRALAATHKFYDVRSEVQDTPQGMVVTFHVPERALVQQVVFEGNQALGADELFNATGLHAGGPMDPALNRARLNDIERKYKEKGYPFAAVELVEGGRSEDSRVLVRIKEGPKTKVRSTTFHGNEFMGNPRLHQFLTTSRSVGVGRFRILGAYEANALDQDVASVVAYYRSHGFLDVKVAPEPRFTPDKAFVDIDYMVVEGPRYTVGNVALKGAGKLPEGTLRELIQVKNGQTFAETDVRKDTQQLKDAYGRRGFVNATVKPDLQFREDPGVVDVVYQVSEDAPKQIGAIRVEGNTHTKGGVINKLSGLEPGTLLDSTKLREGQRRLIESRLFSADADGVPTIELVQPADLNSPFTDLRVTVKEAATGSLMFGVGVNSDTGLGGSIVLNERNFDPFRLPTSWSDLWSGNAFRGAGKELRIEAVPGTQVNRYSATYMDPYLFNTDVNMQLSGYYYNRLFTNYMEERGGGRPTFGYRFNKEWGGSVGMRVENVNIRNPSTPTPPDLAAALGSHFLYGPRAAVTHDTRDSQLNPTTGHYLEGSYEHTFGDYNFGRWGVVAKQYFPLFARRDGSGRNVLSIRGELGWLGSEAPIFERFYAGGFQTLRGFAFRGIGPVQLDQKVGGNFMLLSGIEYYMPLTPDDNLGWVFFSDQGTVAATSRIDAYRVTAGFGLRARVPGMGPVPLAFDFAFPIVKTSTDDRQVFSFSVGIFR